MMHAIDIAINEIQNIGLRVKVMTIFLYKFNLQRVIKARTHVEIP
jgi:hypothetical protein